MKVALAFYDRLVDVPVAGLEPARWFPTNGF